PESEADLMGMGTKFLATMGGVIELYGDMVGSSWTWLARDAHPGDSQVWLQDATGWRPGERIVVASTDFAGYGEDGDDQVEERTVVSVAGDTVELDAPLSFFHQGTLMEVGG